MPILRLEWNPKVPGLFAAGGEDQILKIYNCSKTSKNNGLIFIHPGCQGTISDFNWNPHSDFGLGLVDASN